MADYKIKGGNKVGGKLVVGGAKNAALPILAATVLHKGECVLHGCPNISDVAVTVEILKEIGCIVTVAGGTIAVNAKDVNQHAISDALAGEMRSSVIFAGSLAARLGKSRVPFPGGCRLGARPLDIHVDAFRQLGVNVRTNGFIDCDAANTHGAVVRFKMPSVGATENIMLFATSVDGATTIKNAAKEPEIVDLQNFLIALGAKVSGAGTDTIVIEGKIKNPPHFVEFKVMPDRIAAGTFLASAAITGGEIELDNIIQSDIAPICDKLIQMGCDVTYKGERVRLKAPARLKAISETVTKPHPGFPTDFQAPFAALLTVAEGKSVIKETIFESRTGHVAELQKMGANIEVDSVGKTFRISGVRGLHSAEVSATDLRGGAALVLAALAAEGLTTIKNTHHIERGYEDLSQRLRVLGAEI